ncbi:MAG: hypothetical protein MZU97_06495 [Bacillus subtilis]|nr:hypothetical protein [Bacillus subtilis]
MGLETHPSQPIVSRQATLHPSEESTWSKQSSHLLAGLGAFLVGFKILSDNVQKLANRKLKQLFNRVTGQPSARRRDRHGDHDDRPVFFRNDGHGRRLRQRRRDEPASGDDDHHGRTTSARPSPPSSSRSRRSTSRCTRCCSAAIGIFGEMFAKQDKTKTVFYALAGLGLVFIGLSIMGDSMRIFRSSPSITAALTTINNPSSSCF